MKYPRVRDVLNRLKWSEEDGLSRVILTVKDRTTGTKEINGPDITTLGHRYFEVGDSSGNSGPPTTIPYYKIVRIVLNGETIWKRPDA